MNKVKYAEYLRRMYYHYKHSGNMEGAKRIYIKLWKLGIIL